MADYIPKKQEDMKRLLFILGLFVCIGLHAQNDILSEIEKGNAAYNTIQGDFTQTKTLAAKGTKVQSEGMLYISGDH